MPPKKTTGEKTIDEMTVPELKEELKAKGLDTTGKKADLLARLKGESGEEEVHKGTKRSVEEDAGDKKEKRGKKKAKVIEEDEELTEEKPTRSSGRTKEKVKAASEKESKVGVWENDGSLYHLTPSSIVHSSKVASFDMDDTLIETESGRTFALGRSDWWWLYPEIPKKLKELYANGVKVVIFTNQAGIGGKGWDQSKFNAVSGKIQDLSTELGIPLQAYIATADDEFRKPSTKMWQMMANNNGGIALDLDSCIFVGDAAGRAAGWKSGRKKDFSCSDRKFAHNIGIKFSTPEEYFLGEPSAEFAWDSFDIASIPTHGSTEITEGGVATLTASGQEMVIFVGFPASGKSTLAKTYMVPHGYVHVNRDTLKTQDKCIKAAKEALADGKSVVIDNTNPGSDNRAAYIGLARNTGVPVRCFRFDVDEKLAQHLNMFRERAGISPHVSRIGYNMYKKNFTEPTLKEGFDEVKKIRFVAKFENPDHEKLFTQLA